MVDSSATDDSTAVLDGAQPGLDERGGTAMGASVGRYIVLEEVGRGGMGRVLRAYDPKLQREVALKEVRRGALGSEGTIRLVAEARAMAKLSHPNVVAVYDVEELASGEISVVMEYVRGANLKEWLRGSTRAWREIVDAFREAGRGLAAAHHAGILHRDFKPANVMMADDGAVKVMDFGLAKADPSSPSSDTPSLDESGTDSQTEAGTVMGTPRYMSPEQHRGEPLCAAADQYAFCVALWEALCEEPPFLGGRLPTRKLDGPPPWPNSAIPRPVAAAIRRGLSPLEGERWPDMEALLDALAYDPARRRTRWVVGLSAAAAIAVGGMSFASRSNAPDQRCTGAAEHLTGIWDDARRAEVETAMRSVDLSYAPAAWDRTSTELDVYAGAWASMHTEACEATTIRGEQSAAMMDRRMACLQRAKTGFDAAVGVLATADAKVVENAHRIAGGLAPLSSCADVEALQAEVVPPSPDEAEAVRAAREVLARAAVEAEAGRYGEAKAKVDAAKEALENIAYPPVHAEVALREGSILETLGQYDAAVEALERAVEVGSRSQRWDVVVHSSTRLISTLGESLRKPEDGLRYLPLARGLASDPRTKSALAYNLALVLRAQGKLEESEAQYRNALALRREALGPDDPRIASTLNSLANVLRARGKYEESVAEHRHALDITTRLVGPDHPRVAAVHNNLGIVLRQQGKHEEAEASVRRAMAIWDGVLEPDHPNMASSRENLAMALFEQGKREEAEAEHRKALAVWERALGPEHPHVAGSRANLAAILGARGMHEQAESELRGAVAVMEKALGAGHPDAGTLRFSLAISLDEQGKDEPAEAEYRRALSVLGAGLGSDHPEVVDCRSTFADFLRERGRPSEAAAVTGDAKP